MADQEVKKVTELTPYQEEQLEVYKQKWIAKGLSTDPVDPVKAKEFASWLYKKLDRAEPEIIIKKGPVDAWLATQILDIFNSSKDKEENEWTKAAKKSDGLISSRVNTVFEEIKTEFRTRHAGIFQQMMGTIHGKDSPNTLEEPGVKVVKMEDKKVEKMTEENFINHVLNSSKSFTWPSLSGQFDAPFFSFYDYVDQVLGIKLDPDFYELIKSVDFGLIYPIEGFCIFSERLEGVSLNSTGVLHCEKGPALRYQDDFEIYALNGVIVPKDLVLTPADKLDPKLIVKERNAEVRKEIVRKIGMERVLDHLKSKLVDEIPGYQLVYLDIDKETQRPYLKMKNPSTGVWHVEGVPPGTKSCREALAWRNGLDLYVPPVVLT
jgi:hypothetical protein